VTVAEVKAGARGEGGGRAGREKVVEMVVVMMKVVRR